MWCMFAVNAEITLNASERAPPAEQYVLHPQAELRAARRGKTSSHPAHGRAADRDTLCSPTGWDVPPNGPPAFRLLGQETLLFQKKKTGVGGWGKKEEKEPECVNHTHHYHNRLRSWLVDDWFTSSCCKPRRERRWKSPYLFVRTAGGSGRYMGGCSLPATGAPAATPISSWIDPHDRSVPPVVFSSQTRISRARNQDSSLLAKGRCCGVDGTSGNTSRWNADEFLAPSCVTAACGAGPRRSKVVPNSQHT